MESFTRVTGIAAPLQMVNVDTDMIIPKQHCKSVKRTGYGPHLFHDIRYFPGGRERPDFALNRPPFRDAVILIARANFGCGSSREAAVWALRGFGIRCVIAPSFSDIFANNCFQNGMLPVRLPEETVEELLAGTECAPDARMTVDLVDQRITVRRHDIPFQVDSYRRDCLLRGLDEIGVTLTHEAEIAAHEVAARPWRRLAIPDG